MELTAKEILEKHIVVSEKFEVAILAAIKEAVELAYREGWEDRDSASNEDEHISLKEDLLNTTINSLFPESK